MNNKIDKYLKRLEELIKQLEKWQNAPEIRRSIYTYLDIPKDKDKKLQMDVKIILKNIFGEDNEYSRECNQILDRCNFTNHRVEPVLGVLKSALENIKGGYIEGIEIRIANEIFDNLLEEAKHHIFKQKNEDIGAMLLRIILEDNLKRIANKEKINIKNEKGRDKQISSVNDELKKEGIYNQTQWRQIQTWLDIGNNAHHGKFDEYTLGQVEDFYKQLKNFIVRFC